ncbi:MAG: tRNA (adenosine(37)-N6)-dimethylallyltransferase MiaA [Acidobacteria bacterium]|nr:tRNA (adenosine(37)-N6)-dimethylallyltransferase MiaA [Acidobacteriota bacterium]
MRLAAVAIVGPTASGKTRLACALADRVRCHLVSCDALQVYRDLRVATEKPRGDDARHPWALVDVVEPDRDVNLGAWVRAADAELRWAASAGRLPLLVGGTGLYLRGLAKGVAEAPPRDPALRARLAGLLERRGSGFLHRVLRRIDPAGAARLRPGDRQRLVRALEVRLLSGRSLAELQARGWAGPDRFPLLRIGLALGRQELAARIDARVARYPDAGLVPEVEWLTGARGVPREANSLRALGYRETLGWLSRPAAERRVEDLVAEIQANTRRYAKRQMTWFRSEPTTWLDAGDPRLVERTLDLVDDWRRGLDPGDRGPAAAL